MDVREKLVELLTGHSIDTKTDVEYVADHLIAHGVTVQEWISVKDRLPEVLGCFRILDENKGADGIATYNPKTKLWQLLPSNNALPQRVTHWRYLP